MTDLKAPSNQESRALNDIPEREWTEFAKRVKEANGKLKILVHPFYATPQHSTDYLPTIERILQKLHQTKTPLLFLEEYPKIYATSKRLSEIMGAENFDTAISSGKLFIVATINDASVIVTTSSPFRSDNDLHKVLIRRLVSKGVKSVWIGGMLAKDAFYNELRTLVKEYEVRTLPEKKNVPAGAERAPGYSWTPLIAGCAGGLRTNFIYSGKFNSVKWLPNALDIRFSPYPPKHQRKGKVTLKKAKKKPKPHPHAHKV